MSEEKSSSPSPRDPISRFLSEQQDPAVAGQVFEKVSQILTAGEEIAYIAVEKPLVSLTPDSVVLTNKRFIIYRPKLLGRVEFEDHIWRDLKEAQLKEGVINSTFSITKTNGEHLVIEHLPKAQARKVYGYAQQMEEYVREERRTRDMEEKRAAAGGVNIGGLGQVSGMASPAPQAAPAAEDPVAKLSKLKQMLDNGLITQQEYDAKKSDILSRL